MAAPPSGASTKDTKDLHELGYAQELNRSMSKFSNFAVSFTIISILSGCLTAVRVRPPARRPARHALGLAARGRARALRRHVDGRDLLVVPDRRRPLLLGGQAGPRQERSDLVVVHRLVQPPRSGRRHRRHQLRLRLLHLGVPRYPTGSDFWMRLGHHLDPARSSSSSRACSTRSACASSPCSTTCRCTGTSSAWLSSSSCCSWPALRHPPDRESSSSAARAGTRSRACPASRCPSTCSSSAC